MSQTISTEQQILSSRVTELVVAAGYPSPRNYSGDLLAAVNELNAFYAAHPEIIAQSKAQVRRNRNRKFRMFRD